MTRVVVVDDSLDVQRSLTRLLETIDGVEVVGFAEDTAGAIGLIDHQRPDLVVLDVELRHGDRGFDVLRHVVRQHPGTEVIAMSNFHWHDMREGFLRAGASAYFDKSLEFTKGRDWIAALARRARPRLGTP
ncbi:MAG: hypothetical protein Tsb007_43720 [Rhizobacter sp.]